MARGVQWSDQELPLLCVLARGVSDASRRDGCLAPGHPVCQYVFGTSETPTFSILVTSHSDGQSNPEALSKVWDPAVAALSHY